MLNHILQRRDITRLQILKTNRTVLISLIHLRQVINLLHRHSPCIPLELVRTIHLVGHVINPLTSLEERVDDADEGTVPEVEGGGSVGADGVVLAVHALVFHGVQDINNGTHTVAGHAVHAVFGHVDQFLGVGVGEGRVIVRVGGGGGGVGGGLVVAAAHAFDVHHGVDVVVDYFVSVSERQHFHVVEDSG